MHTGPPYHIMQSGSAICMDCLMKDGPIYHELEALSDSKTLNDTTFVAPPVPPRDHPPPPPKEKDPVYERVGSLSKDSNPRTAPALPPIDENSMTRKSVYSFSLHGLNSFQTHI